MAKVEFTSAELIARLAARFSGQEWAFFEQVPSCTAGAPRTADALAMNLWPSRGLEVHGFEVKISRSDWLRELKKPEKAEEIAAYCDRWWLVVSEAKIVQHGELPPSWGLLGPRGDGLVTVIEAPKLTPKPLDRNFVAAILRKACNGVVPASELDARVEKARADIEEASRRQMETLRESLDALHGRVTDFEKRSGLSLRYSGPELGDAVYALLHGDREHLLREMRHVRNLIGRSSEELDKGIAAIEAAPAGEAVANG